MIVAIRICGSISLLVVLSLGHLVFSSSSAIQLTHGPSGEVVLGEGPGREWFTFAKFFPSSNDTSKQETPELWIGSWSEPFQSRRILLSVDAWDDWDGLTWSPDGKWIAYTSAGQLHKLNRSSGEKVQLTSFPSEGDFGPGLRWLLDGSIRAVRDCTLISVSEERGDVRELMSFKGPNFSDWTCPDAGDFLSHSPDGRFLVAQIDSSHSSGVRELVFVDVKGGETRKLTSTNCDEAPTWVDSQTVLFSRICEEGKAAVLELNVLSGSVRELASGSLFVGPVLRHPNGEWIVVARSSLTQTRKESKQRNLANSLACLERFLASFRLWKITVKSR